MASADAIVNTIEAAVVSNASAAAEVVEQATFLDHIYAFLYTMLLSTVLIPAGLAFLGCLADTVRSSLARFKTRAPLVTPPPPPTAPAEKRGAAAAAAAADDDEDEVEDNDRGAGVGLPSSR